MKSHHDLDVCKNSILFIGNIDIITPKIVNMKKMLLGLIKYLKGKNIG